MTEPRPRSHYTVTSGTGQEIERSASLEQRPLFHFMYLTIVQVALVLKRTTRFRR